MRIAGAAAVLALALALAPSAFGDARIVEHDIRAAIDPYRSRLEATDRFTVVGHEKSVFRFLLNKQLEIASLSLDGAALRWQEEAVDPSRWGEEENVEGGSWEAAREIVVNLPVRRGDSLEVAITYGGAVLDSLRAPKEGYERSFETTSGLIEERGAYLSGSTVWVPTVPGDLFTFRLEARVPREWESVSQGALLARFEEGGARVSRWRAAEPMEEAYLVAGPYVFREADFKGAKIQTFLYEAEDAARLHDTYVVAARTFLDRYGREIGAYPFPKFALVENFWQTGFGMPSFTLLGTQVIRLPFIPGTSFGHEILHNWWGNGVYVEWEKGNWCEGLTAYGADYAYKEDRSPEDAANYRRGELQKFQNYVGGHEDFPLVKFRSRSDATTQAVGYSKAMMVFHMLRREIGNKGFREGQRVLFRDRLFRPSSWRDVRDAFEEASGANLETFFRQWTEREGAPVLFLTDVGSKAVRGGRFEVKGIVRQEAPAYRLDVPVRIETEEGPESLVVYLTGEMKAFEWKGKSRPFAAAVDPAFDLFRRLHREEIPPALSQTLGADSLWIVLPPEGASPADSALSGLADSWAGRPGVRITREALPEETFARSAVWLFGPTVYGERFAASLPPGTERAGGSWRTPAGEFPADSHSIVLTTRHPVDPDLSWSLFDPENAEVVPVLARKIPHYGKYGYLVFQGTENVGKGEWEAAGSPLRAELAP
ncbi:MAG: M1 family aminopeptidase [Candidatus Eisenbacteria bacterium]